MSAIEILPVITDRAAWLRNRMTTLNASEIAACRGVHDHEDVTLAKVVAEKRGMQGLGPKDSELLARGHALQDDAVDEVRKLRPTWKIELCNNQYIDRARRLAAHPDALIIDPARDGIGVGQIKVVTHSKFEKKYGDGVPPLGVLLQNSCEMMLVPGCTWGAVLVLEIGEFIFRAHVFPFERDAGAERELLATAEEFWRVMDSGEHPVVNFERDGALIKLMFPDEVKGKIIDLTTDNRIRGLLESREALREAIKEQQDRLEACENEIKAKVGDAERALIDDWTVTYKTQHRDGYTAQPTSFRVLRTKRIVEKATAAA